MLSTDPRTKKRISLIVETSKNPRPSRAWTGTFESCLELLLQFFQDFAGRVSAGASGESGAGVSSGAAEVQVLDRRAVACPVQQGTHGEELVQREFAVEYVSAS